MFGCIILRFLFGLEKFLKSLRVFGCKTVFLFSFRKKEVRFSTKMELFIFDEVQRTIPLLALCQQSPVLLKVIPNFHREQHIRSIYQEEWINRYLNYDFFRLFRMSKETFEKLLRVIICPELQKPYRGGGVPLTAERALLITLWWLGSGDSLNLIADRFDVTSSTVYVYANIILHRLTELIPKYIQWPSEEEIVTIERQFRQICGYPGVIGAIDGCNVNFKAPANQQDSYVDKNDKHSIKIQAVTTATKLFTNINIGFPGSVHDSRMLTNSQLYQEAQFDTRKYFPSEEYHLLGDKAYPVLEWLITPFKDYGNQTRRQKIHNFRHSKTRIKVEHTFGIWKARWRILKYINVNCPKKATFIIGATCVLHNFCYQNSDEWEEQLDIIANNEERVRENIFPNEQAGLRKRDHIADSFPARLLYI